MTNRNFKIGQIVPSSNTTMETEIPAILRAREDILPERFTFHSSRMRMKKVTKSELELMDADSLRCALELSDAHVDVIGYACLVAIMSMGNGYHVTSQNNLYEQTVKNEYPTSVITSAGALVEGLHTLKAKNIAIITPYMKPLTKLVVDYLTDQGFNVVDSISLEIPDNLEVAAQNPENLKEIYKKLDTDKADVVVLSACVQMPSLPSVDFIEKELGKPVTTASICTTYKMLKELGLETKSTIGGELLSGRH
ncbi:maleate cis-trans isomerase family protein [Aquimarina algiphila]|uniref:maleate cis-trans isomerase family protein n=1 Tax=Aquimarina algiphila TaxID=2047982 RepID=UPI0024933532|nr:Asp/Glu racemase [Aquimarina algiphila]